MFSCHPILLTKVCNLCNMTGKTHGETVGRPSTYKAFVWEYFGYREESRHEFESNREFSVLFQVPLLTDPHCSLQKALGSLHCGSLCFYSVYFGLWDNRRGRGGSAHLFVRMTKLRVIKPKRLAAPGGYMFLKGSVFQPDNSSLPYGKRKGKLELIGLALH